MRAISSWGLRSHGPNVSDGSVSEPAGASAPPERKFFATSSETSESRAERGWGCNSKPQRLREAEKESGGDRGVERDSRGSEAVEPAWQPAGLAAP